MAIFLRKGFPHKHALKGESTMKLEVAISEIDDIVKRFIARFIATQTETLLTL